jgi:hypothetical protein
VLFSYDRDKNVNTLIFFTLIFFESHVEISTKKRYHILGKTFDIAF